MSREPQTPPTTPAEPRSAAEWFVALDAARAGDDTRDVTAGDDARAAAWMDESADNDAALARCAAAVAIARGLADDPELRWAYDEAAAIASGDAAARGDVARRGRRRRVAWTGAGLAAAAAAAAALVLSLHGPPPTTAEPARVVSRAAEIVAATAGFAPVVLLPGGVAVDANSVAVLPFESAGDETGTDAAALLQNAIVADLAMVPGIYVRGGSTVAPYAQSDLSATEIGVLLGTRGIVSGQVEQRPAGVRVHAQVTDAATNRIVFRADYDTTLGELRSVRTELVDGIAATLADPTLRRSALRAASSARGDNTLASVAEPAFDR